jgi:hypothetical protein
MLRQWRETDGVNTITEDALEKSPGEFAPPVLNNNYAVQ